MGDVFGVDDALLAGGLHLRATEAGEGGAGDAGAEASDDLCAVVVAGGLAGGEEEERIGRGGDEGSLSSQSRGLWRRSLATKKAATKKSANAGRAQSFRARLEKGDRALGWTIARVPFGPEALGEMVRLRVQGEIRAVGETRSKKSVEFRTSLFPDAGRGGFYLLVNRAMQQGVGVFAGDEAEFVLRADHDPREAELPDELAALLDGEPGLRAWYDELSEYMRREIGKWINGVKSDEARLRRAEQTAERLMSAMEGERELPPAIAAAFRERPKARAGWAKMSETKRRGELLAVFHYLSQESREKRIQKLCDEAEKKA
ncbi:MAG TPA: YdeI/OmpD-associated family protein [Acidobacteriaceae bacterium]|nr:YdeI/OmpD-associated family protein [Acidobacteriaceae bacterium]